MLRAVIFDFDGVITDSEILHLRSFNQALTPFKIKITIKDYYRDYLGLTDFDCFKAVTQNNRIAITNQQTEQLLENKKQIFETLAQTEGKIIDGVRSFIDLLKKNNIEMAICSGALLAEIELVLQQSRLRKCFKAIVSAEQVKRGKPYPDGFLLALKRLNSTNAPPISPPECIVIEDSHWGLEAAHAAKMHTIAVTNSYDADDLKIAEKTTDNLNKLQMKDLHSLCS